MLQRPIWQRIQWKSLIQPWQNIDWTLLVLIVGVTGFGGILIRSAELNQGWTDWMQHWIIGGIGLILALLLARTRYEYLLQFKWVIYAVTNLSLLAVMFVGTSALGAQRWISIGGFYIQPSEFAKVGVIITLAAMLHERTASTIPAMLRALAVTAVPWGLVFIQPDLGTSLVFGAISLGMLYWGNANPGWLVLMISPIISTIFFNLAFVSPWFIGVSAVWVVLTGAIAWRTLPWHRLGTLATLVVNLLSGGLGHFLWDNVLKDYQKDRLVLFLDPDKDPLGGGYHLIQSRIAIGSGQLWGHGLNQGTQTQLNFIPEQHTDFIFSAIGEELGFVGCMALLAVFWLICLRLVIIAQNAKDNFGSLLAVGVLSMLLFQLVVNIGMTIGLAPVTGIPLPFISYGRSALLTNFVAIGLVESVANFRQRVRY
ncbi:MAG TPA: rod shape-determining protein RodA [Leptolyngbyaceae cyanobacterium M33_DOE_097]|uniref:Peptidoglycan glycosyltransferase RodA n=1 Tax=Oscillatoriales cyanobacterium SpSt-418 TaxID=2282169 RepID=A0A7C3KJF8_9CYAN|nr:rod shape-determining protein RodA [Leptolyngbyaceae cyanobacterium M33_DOE_097]